MAEEATPIVGVGVMIVKDGNVLLGRRRSSHGTGEYAFPSGKVANLETFEECAGRVTKTDCGMEITNVQFQFLANIRHYAPTHYIFVGMVADWKSGEPETLPEGTCVGWRWCPLDAMPRLVFKNVELAMQAHTDGTRYFPSVD